MLDAKNRFGENPPSDMMMMKVKNDETAEPLYNCMCGSFYKESEKDRHMRSEQHILGLPKYAATLEEWRAKLKKMIMTKMIYGGKKHINGDFEEPHDEDYEGEEEAEKYYKQPQTQPHTHNRMHKDNILSI